MSSDGRYVVMQGGGGSNYCDCPSGHYELYVRDRQVSDYDHVSSDAAGNAGNGINYNGSISDDGRYVAFSSTSSNLVPNDTNGKEDVFVKDRQTEAIARVSVHSNGNEGNGTSELPVISDDGRHVVFESSASNLVDSDANGVYADIFVHDRTTGNTSLVSLTDADTQLTTTHSSHPDISTDGRYVVWDSSGAFAPGNDAYLDVFVRDRVAGTTELVSRNDPFTGGGVEGFYAKISGDGRFVAYMAYDAKFQAYRYDRRTGVTKSASVDSSGQPGDAHSMYPRISPDGRAVGFESHAALVSDDTNGQRDAYVHDFQAGKLDRVSMKSDGTQSSSYSDTPKLSTDGRYAFFTSWAALAPPDTSSDDDTFLRDRGTQPPRKVPIVQTYGPAGFRSGWLRSTTRQEADPVDTATGTLVAEVTDAALPGTGETFTLTRSYTSADTTTGPLGPGWTHPYLSSLSVDAGSQDVTARTEGGAQVEYPKTMDGSYDPANGVVADLEAVGSDYEITTEDLRTLRYDSTGRLVAVEDGNGQGLSLAYDTDGNLASVSGSGRTVTFTYDANDLLTRMDLPDGRHVAYGYTSGRLTSVTDLAGGTTSYTYDANGWLATIVDQNNHTVASNVYDAEGRVVSQTDARNNTGTFSYVDNGDGTQTTTYTDARSNAWVDVYAGNVLLSSADPLGNTTSYSYDADYNVTSVTDPRGNTTSMTYDVDGTLASRTAPSPLSYQESWTYNAAGQVLTHTNARAKTTTNAYDTAGNLTSVTDPASGVVSFAYDTSGRLTSSTDPRSKVTTFAYNTAGNLTSVTDPTGGITTHSYSDPSVGGR